MYVQYRRGAQYRGGYHDAYGDILSTVEDIVINVGGYFEYCGRCSVPWGIS